MDAVASVDSVDSVIHGVLFDFSGTLFHLDPDVGWVDGQGLDRARVIDLLTSPMTAEVLPAELASTWERRDLDRDTHRMVYLVALRTALPGVPQAVLDRIYELVPAPESWTPYPDARDALRFVRDAGKPVAVISNIPWDVSDVFERNGMADLVDEYVLSFREGVMKPDPTIFQAACRRIGVAPERALMVGDNERADGGARQVGCRFAAVERAAPETRPDALIKALAGYRLA